MEANERIAISRLPRSSGVSWEGPSVYGQGTCSIRRASTVTANNPSTIARKMSKRHPARIPLGPIRIRSSGDVEGTVGTGCVGPATISLICSYACCSKMFRCLVLRRLAHGRKLLEKICNLLLQAASYCWNTGGGPLTRFHFRLTFTSTRLAILMKGMLLFIP